MQVKRDGQAVLDASFVADPSSPPATTVGANRIGGSSCGPSFSGTVAIAAHPAFLLPGRMAPLLRKGK
jgi:hypothetical protein